MVMFIAPVKPTLVSTNISLGTRPSSKLHCRLSSNNEATSYKTRFLNNSLLCNKLRIAVSNLREATHMISCIVLNRLSLTSYSSINHLPWGGGGGERDWVCEVGHVWELQT